MPRSRGVRAAQAEDTRTKLMGAARTLFARQGFHATASAEIVAAAGVTRGALQHHFSRKEDLFLAVFEQIEQEMMGASAHSHTDSAGDAWLNLKANLHAYLTAASTPEVQRIILLDGPAVLGWAEWRRLETHYGLRGIVAAVEAGIAAGHIRKQSPETLAHMILSIINEAALMVANSAQPKAAIKNSQLAIDTLLSSLK